MEITLEDLTAESIGISKVRTLLADVQVRSLHGGRLAERINPRPGPIICNLEAIPDDGGTWNFPHYKTKGYSAGASRVIIGLGIAAVLWLQLDQ